MQSTQLGRQGVLSSPFQTRPLQSRPKRASLKTSAFFTKTRVKEDKTTTKTIDKASEYKKRQGFGGIISAFDFAEVRSKNDAELLYEAKYGKLNGGKMSRDQYMALRRKVGGTAKDFWKTNIDVVGEYTDKGWVDKNSTSSSVPALPFLVVTVLALFGTVFFVISQTS